MQAEGFLELTLSVHILLHPKGKHKGGHCQKICGFRLPFLHQLTELQVQNQSMCTSGCPSCVCKAITGTKTQKHRCQLHPKKGCTSLAPNNQPPKLVFTSSLKGQLILSGDPLGQEKL